MNSDPPTESSLDELAARSLTGDQQAETALFEWLSARFRSLAKRRLREDLWEDAVQDALRVVFLRLGERRAQTGTLPWSLQVLRNVIGNVYQRGKREALHQPFDDELHAASTGLSTDAVSVDAVAVAINTLSRDHPRCGAIFRCILESLEEGGGPRDVSNRARARVRGEFPDMTSGSFYVALHRCRARLRDVLRASETVE